MRKLAEKLVNSLGKVSKLAQTFTNFRSEAGGLAQTFTKSVDPKPEPARQHPPCREFVAKSRRDAGSKAETAS